MRVLSSVWFWFSGIFSFFFFAIPAIPSGTKGSIQFAHYWSRLLLKINFIKTQKLSETSYEPGIVYLSNHASIIDILVLFKYLPRPFHFVAKDSLFKVPLFGLLMRIAGFFPLNRENPRRAIQTMSDIADKVKQGHCILLFPEGTRSQDGSVGEFKSGFLKILEKSNAKVKMIYIDGTFPLIKKGTLLFWPGKVTINIGKKILPEQYQNLSKDEALKFFKQKMIELTAKTI